MKFRLKTTTATRALTVYLFVLACGLAAATLLIVEAAIDGPSVKPDAEGKVTFMANLDVVLPEQSPEPATKVGAARLFLAPEGQAYDPRRIDRRDGRELTVQATAVLPLRDSVIGNGEAAPERLLSQLAAVWNANRPTLDGHPISQDLRLPSGKPSDDLTAIERDTPGQLPPSDAATPARPDANRKARSTKRYSWQVAQRPRVFRASPTVIAVTAQPISPGLIGAGCPPGSDPRWSGADGSGASILICNPYYRRVAVDP